jgi:hypothetical protein
VNGERSIVDALVKETLQARAICLKREQLDDQRRESGQRRVRERKNLPAAADPSRKLLNSSADRMLRQLHVAAK